jgi:hypothetical protein
MTQDYHSGHFLRRRLLKGFAAGIFTSLLPLTKVFAATLNLPAKLPVTQSVYRISGKAWVNGNKVDMNTRIGPNDTVKTGKNSELVFVVGDHSMLLRGESHLVIQSSANDNSSSAVISSLRLFAGKLLSASRSMGLQIHTPTATIGIRGTGVYLEAGAEKTYFCACYGDVDVSAVNDASSLLTVHSAHHDKPLYIYGHDLPGKCIHEVNRLARPNHSDDELMLVEALAGRTPPFVS